MSENFFDKSVLETSKQADDLSTLRNYKNLTYNLKKIDDGYSFFCEIDDQRLNQSEMKGILKLNERKQFLKPSEVTLIEYVANKLGPIQTIYRLMNDIEVILTNLMDSNFKLMINEKETKVVSDLKKLSLDIFIDENSNIVLDIKDEGGFIVGNNRAFYLSENSIQPISDDLPIKFYKELFDGHNRFSIETFFDIKDSIVPRLKELHTLAISKDVEELSNLNIEQKVAPKVLEIGKTVHFITLNLKYKVQEEFFNIEDFRYYETTTWLDKQNLIKIAKEDSGLIKYVSDEELSEMVFDELFDGIRIRYSRTEKTPFQINVPISNLESFVKQVLPRAQDMFDIEYKGGQQLSLADGNVKFEIDTNLKRNLNLFEFKVRFKIGDEYFDLDFLKDLMMKNRKYVQLKDGSTVNIENIREINKWIEFLNKFEFKRNGNVYKTESTTALELDEFLKDVDDKKVNANEEYRNMITELKDKTPLEEIHLPVTTKEKLRDYQKEGVFWLHFLKKYGFGGILADEMGLGKTIQALTIMSMNSDGTHMVVCPKSLMYNWENEIKSYYPEMKVLIIDKDSDKRKKLIEECDQYDVVITSYSMLQKDYIHYMENEKTFNYQILDEAHYVKNIKTLSSKAVRIIPAKRKILLTGTPLENNLDELFGTFELIMPGYLGSKTDFRRDFVAKIERNNRIALEILQAKIRPFILRRTKKEVLKELPEKQEQTVYNEMTNKQVVVYNEILNRVKNEVNELIEKQGFEKSRIQVLSALLKLRQVCNHPGLVEKGFKKEEDISGKYDQFVELLTEVIESGEKVLVFSQFTSMLDIFEKDLKTKGIKYVRLDGSTKNRQDVVDKFNEDESIPVFLISLKAGGVGLNLTSASAVFLYDPWWNPMAEQQAIDRAHRIGQKKTVNIYKFITRNSIEEKILNLQKRKGNLFDNLVVEDQGFMKRLEWEDLMELFD